MPYKEKKGIWRAKVVSQGKPYTRRCKNKKEALAWEAKIRKELKETSRKTLTVSLLEVATKYLKYCEIQYSRSTFTDKRKALKELMTVTGNIGIEQVGADVILHKVLLCQPTPNLHNKRRKDLHAFFEYCKNFHGLKVNPVTPINKLPIDRKPQPVPTEEEFLKLLMAADRHDKNLLITCASTGGRKSEVLRLTWTDDVNFKEKKVRLGNRKNRVREMRYRWIDMNEEVYETLMDQYKTRLPHSDYVFQNIDPRSSRYGDRYTARRRFMAGLRKRAGIEKRIGFHALRRFFGSLLADNREKLPTIQKLLGHANVSTTDRYIYRLKDDTKQAVEKIKFEKKAHEGSTQNKKG